MSSLFKRVTLPLLAVAAAGALSASLCAPTQAATASWSIFGPYNADIAMQVKCSIQKPYTFWTNADFYVQLVGGNAYPDPLRDYPNLSSGPSGGDYLDPPYGPMGYSIQDRGGNPVHGTYNCWCKCSGGDSSNVPWGPVSTGGTLINR